jgi:decaprenylphospho-beta-D-erythro-pentofuranosid-2-ulose 2-reductase
VVLGGKSDLAHSILEYLPISTDAEIVLCGRDIAGFRPQENLNQYRVRNLELDFVDLRRSEGVIDEIFVAGKVDLVIIAYAILGNEKHQLNGELFREVLETNFFSQALLLNLINAKMVDQSHGQILQISSVAGIRPRKRNFVYGVSKFGVDFIAQGLQKVNTDVHITILRPGFVYTKMTSKVAAAPFPTNRNRVAKIAVSGLLKKKRVVYAPRILVVVMFVLKLFPERLFRIIDN